MTNKCLACGGTTNGRSYSAKDWWFQSPGSFIFVMCEQCQSLQQSPPPSEEILRRGYETYYTHHRPERRGILTRAIRRIRAGSLLRELRRVGDGTVLDYGCGSGQDLELLSEAGWDVIGLEPDPVARTAALEVTAQVFADIDSIPAHLDVDVILMRHVIEHVQSPHRLLAQLLRRFDGPTFVLITPNSLSLGRRIFRGRWRGFDAPRHVMVFSPSGIRHLADRAGLRAVSISDGVTSIGGTEAASMLSYVDGSRLAYLPLRILGAIIGLCSWVASRAAGIRCQEELFATLEE